MRKALCAAALYTFMMPAAHAASLILDLPGNRLSQETLVYDCGSRKVEATYINADDIAFAMLKFDGRTVIMANVISGSGARYAGQELIWWSKGAEATLYDLRKGDDDPGESCKSAE